MADLLVKLYELPDARPRLAELQEKGVRIRIAMAYEKHHVVEWVRDRFSMEWASECDVAFSNRPISCFIATRRASLVGFACFDCTSKSFFGPIGVAEHARTLGIGTALLLVGLRAMAASGYAYAIIGGVKSREFYSKTVGAIEIPGSSPGVYRDRLKEGLS